MAVFLVFYKSINPCLFLLVGGLWGRTLGNVTLNAILCIAATVVGMIFFKRIYG